MIEAITTYINGFLSGGIEPFWPHVVMIAGSIAAEFSVAIGIILESPKEKHFKEKLGMTLVLGGVLVSALFTICLFLFFFGISRAQNKALGDAKGAIEALNGAVADAKTKVEGFNTAVKVAEKQIGDLNRDVKSAQEKVADRVLKPEQVAAITSAARAFPGQVFKYIPRCSSQECNSLAVQIVNALGEANWNFDPPPKGTNTFTAGAIPTGVIVNVSPSAQKLVQQAAETLVAALNKAGILAFLGDASADASEIVINVSLHP